MICRCLPFFVLVLLCIQSLWAVCTETHTYIVDYPNDRIVVIDRKTESQSFIDCPSPVSLFIYNGKGYVGRAAVGYWGVLDLSTHKFSSKIYVITCKDKILFHGDKGYAYSESNDFIDVLDLEKDRLEVTIKVGTISSFMIHERFGYVFHLNTSVKKICLTDNKVLHTFPVLQEHGAIVLKLYKNKGYLVNLCSGCLTIFDLVELMYQGQITVGKSPRDMEIRDGFGYVPNKQSHTLTVIDLSRDEETCTIPIGPFPSSVVFYRNRGFVLHENTLQIYMFDLLTNTALSVLDLTYFWKLIDIQDLSEIVPMLVLGNYGVVQHTSTKFTIVNLESFEVIDFITLPHGGELSFTDTHFYFGSKKLKPRPDYCCLFEEPYRGIEGYHLEKDADAAFSAFEKEVQHKNFKRAKEFFDIAISLGHPKAFSVALFSFFHGKFGAIYDINWAKEFIPGIDLMYYENLCKTQGFPCIAPAPPHVLNRRV